MVIVRWTGKQLSMAKLMAEGVQGLQKTHVAVQPHELSHCKLRMCLVAEFWCK